MMAGRRGDGLATLPFFLLMAAVFVVYVGYGIVLPLLPFPLERLLGEAARFSVAWHTGMIAGTTLGFMAGPLLGGWLTELQVGGLMEVGAGGSQRRGGRGLKPQTI